MTQSDLLKKMAMAMLVGTMALGVVACDSDDGPAEEAGQSVDETVDDAGDSMDEMGDSAEDSMEDAGDSMEEAGDDMQDETQN